MANFSVVNLTGGTLFLQLHDAAALPADGAVPARVWEVGAGQTYEWDEPDGRHCTNGAVLAMSTTQGTLTVTVTPDALLDATYFVANP